MFDQILLWMVLVLPVAFGFVLIVVPAQRENEQQHMRWRRILGILFFLYSVLVWIQQSRERESSAKDRQGIIEQTAAETSARVFKAEQETRNGIYDRLDSFAARAKSREQKEAAKEIKRDIQTHDLRQRAAAFTAKLRSLEKNHLDKLEAISGKVCTASPTDNHASDSIRACLHAKDADAIEEKRVYEAEFKKHYLSIAQSLRGELLSNLPQQPPVPNIIEDVLVNGNLDRMAPANLLSRVADYLNGLAAKLP